MKDYHHVNVVFNVQIGPYWSPVNGLEVYYLIRVVGWMDVPYQTHPDPAHFNIESAKLIQTDCLNEGVLVTTKFIDLNKQESISDASVMTSIDHAANMLTELVNADDYKEALKNAVLKEVHRIESQH